MLTVLLAIYFMIAYEEYTILNEVTKNKSKRIGQRAPVGSLCMCTSGKHVPSLSAPLSLPFAPFRGSVLLEVWELYVPELWVRLIPSVNPLLLSLLRPCMWLSDCSPVTVFLLHCGCLFASLWLSYCILCNCSFLRPCGCPTVALWLSYCTL